MKYIYINLLLFTGMLFFTACYEDKGNYDYIDYNKIEIKVDITSTKDRVVLGENVVLVPKITWKYPDQDTTDNAWKFEWKKKDEVLSTDRILTYPPSTTGNMLIVLFVTEKATGIVTSLNFYISVGSEFDTGWLILSRKNESPSLSFIRKVLDYIPGVGYEYSWNESLDFYTQMHPDEPLPSTAYGALPYIISWDDDDILLMHESGDWWIMDGQSFKKSVYLEDEFLTGYPPGFKPKYFGRGGKIDYILGTNGKICWRENMDASIQAHVDPFISEYIYFPQDAIIREIIPTNYANQILMYDELNNRLLSCKSDFMNGMSAMGTITPYSSDLSSDKYIDLNDLGDYEFIYCEAHNNGNDYTIILKDPSTGKYILQVCSTSLSSFAGPKRVIKNSSIKEFAGDDLITSDTKFCRTRMLPYLFFSRGSKLYYYEINTERVKLYTDLGHGTITHLIQELNSLSIAVGTDAGEFYTFNTSDAVMAASDPGLVGVILHYDNIGPILDIQWKYGGYLGTFEW